MKHPIKYLNAFPSEPCKLDSIVQKRMLSSNPGGGDCWLYTVFSSVNESVLDVGGCGNDKRCRELGFSISGFARPVKRNIAVSQLHFAIPSSCGQLLKIGIAGY